MRISTCSKTASFAFSNAELPVTSPSAVPCAASKLIGSSMLQPGTRLPRKQHSRCRGIAAGSALASQCARISLSRSDEHPTTRRCEAARSANAAFSVSTYKPGRKRSPRSGYAVARDDWELGAPSLAQHLGFDNPRPGHPFSGIGSTNALPGQRKAGPDHLAEQYSAQTSALRALVDGDQPAAL